MVKGRLIIDGVWYKWLPNQVSTASGDFRAGDATASAKGLLRAAPSRNSRRAATSKIRLTWGQETFCSILLYDHLLCLHQLKRPWYLKYDDVFSAEEELLTKVSSTVYMLGQRWVKPKLWTPVNRVDWTDCILVDGAPVSTSAFTVDESEGAVTFTSPQSGVVSAAYSAYVPVVVDAFNLAPVTQTFLDECDSVMACQGSVDLLTVESGLEAWPIYTGCLTEGLLAYGGGSGDDDWFATVEPPLPNITRKTKRITPSVSRSQATCGNGTSGFTLTWPSLALPSKSYLMKATFSSKIAASSESFWIAPISQDIDHTLVQPNESEQVTLARRVGDTVTAFFTTSRLVSYSSPYWDNTSKLLDWRWLKDQLNTLETFDSIPTPVDIAPIFEGFYNYVKLVPDTAMGTLMTAALNASNYELELQGVSGSGSVDWEGASAGVKYGVTVVRDSNTEWEFQVWPGTPTSPVPSAVHPDTIEWVKAEAKLTGSLTARLRWKRAHDLGRIKRVKATWTVRAFGQASAPAHYDTNRTGEVKWARARVGSTTVTADDPTVVDVTLRAEVEKIVEEWIDFDEASQVGRSRAISVEASARSHSGTHTVDRTAGTWDAQAGVYMKLESLSCGGQLLDLSDLFIDAEWIPASLWQVTPSEEGEYGSLSGSTFTAAGTIPVGDSESPTYNLEPGSGFNGGFVGCPDYSDTSTMLWRTLEHILREQAPAHGSDQVTGFKISFDARTPSGSGSVAPAILPASLSGAASWLSTHAQSTTTSWQSFDVDVLFEALIYDTFTTISDLGTMAFAFLSTSDFEVRNIKVSVYYRHEDV